MKKGKKAAVSVLAVLLIFCSVPFPAAAETDEMTESALSFEEQVVLYIFGENEGICSAQQVSLLNEDNRESVLYSIEENSQGINIDSKSGIVSIDNYDKLYSRLEEKDLVIKVSAVLPKSEENIEEQASYMLKISINAAPEESYTLAAPDGDNGWYRENAAVKAEEGYALKSGFSEEEREEIFFSGMGMHEEGFFVVKKSSGEIYRKESICISSDNEAPSAEHMYIEFPEHSIVEKLGIKTGFFRDFVKVRLKVNKEAFKNQSDIWSVWWAYENHTGEILSFKENEEWYYADLKIEGKESNIRGNFSFAVKDRAGNESGEKKSEEVIVLDKESPVIDIYEDEQNSQGDTDIYVSIQEENFYREDVNICVLKDNMETDKVKPVWTKDGNIHTGKISLRDEGLYSVRIFYEGDPAGNKAVLKDESDFEGYINDTVLIDKTAPVLKFDFGKQKYFSDEINGEIYVEERNFRSEDVVLKAVNKENKEYEPHIKWESAEEDLHRGTFNIKEEGEYILKAAYTDVKGNTAEEAVSEPLIIDKTAPLTDIGFLNEEVKNQRNGRSYFNSNQQAEVVINEKYFNKDLVELNVLCLDSEGKNIEKKYDLCWENKGDLHKAVIDFDEGNYTFSVTCKDPAGNMTISEELYFTVDKTKPENLKLLYGRSENEIDGVSYYRDQIMLTLYGEDMWSGIDYYIFKFNEEEKIIKAEPHKEGGACVFIPEEVLKKDNRIRGKVSFSAVDLAGNQSEVFSDGKVLVADNICPELTVIYEEPVNVHNGRIYYNHGTEVRIRIKEENFFPEDVKVSVNMDGKVFSPDTVWEKKEGNLYEGVISFSDDAHYILNISYSDRSSNEMNSYRSDTFVVDTEIEKPEINVKNLVPWVRFSDRNIYSSDVKMMFTDAAGNVRDVTERFLKSKDVNSASFMSFPDKRKYDGIYTIKAEMKDFAGNISTASTVFTVNRAGSIFLYDDYTEKLIWGKGSFLKKVKEDICVCELNPDHTVNEKVIITRDGRSYDNVKWNVLKQDGSKSAWNRNDYVISKENFKEDGLYRISLFSSDSAGNRNENLQQNNKAISFTVDNTAPEIVMIKGLDEKIVNAKEQMVEYSAFDAAGIESVRVNVNNREVYLEEEIEKTDFEGRFLVSENFERQSISIEVTDMAGNTYEYKDSITVSTNAFARWLADKKSMILTIFIIFTIISGAVLFKKYKKSNTLLK